MGFSRKSNYEIGDLLEIMELLRSEQGCPWDREQNHESIRVNFLEEVYEAVEAIDHQDAEELREELGDVLLQVVFHTQMEREAGRFDFSDVCDGICKKLILRHPHIFGDVQADTAAEVLDNWEAIKRREKHIQDHTTSLQKVPRALPALMRSAKVQSRAAKANFDYTDAGWAMRDLCSEVEELRQAMEEGDPAHIEEELGDLLFAAVNVSRFVKADAERSLEKACDKFIRRFAEVESLARERGIRMEETDIQELDNLWQEAKIKINFGGRNNDKG